MTPGTQIAGKYRLSHLLGEGAMGVVWAAVNERTEREVALKLINGENDGLRRRLLREARACGRLVHRNIIEILDVGETKEGEPFLVMPLLSGETLADRLKRDGLLAPPLAARIAADIARGLDAAHAAGIVHRDLKPANVFLHREAGSDDDFVVKVLDFGVSKMLAPGDAGNATMTGGAVGSPLYMSPEQALGDAGVGPRADLWALGVLLFEMLTGTRPFYAATAFSVVAKILRGPIPTVLERAPGVDPALGDVVARCLIRRPADRLGSAAELAALLEPFAGAREHPAPPAPLPEPGFDEEEPTAFFKKPSNAGAAAAEMLAAAEALAASDVLSSAEILTSADVLLSGPVDETAPLPDTGAPASSAPASRDPMSISTMPFVHPGDVSPHREGDTRTDSPPWAAPRRTALWVAMASVGAVGLGVGLYLTFTSAPERPAVPAATVSHSAPPPPAPPATAAATTIATAEPSAAPAGTASAEPAVASAAPAAASAAATTHSKATAPGRPPAAPVSRPGGKIIRETPF